MSFYNWQASLITGYEEGQWRKKIIPAETANKISPILNIGKNGVTDTLIEELNKQIKANRLVKVSTKSAEEGKT